MDEEGLLRISGNQQKINALHKSLDNQWRTHVDVRTVGAAEKMLSAASAHDLAGLLKLFLRLLPESLFTKEFTDLFALVAGFIDSTITFQLLRCYLFIMIIIIMIDSLFRYPGTCATIEGAQFLIATAARRQSDSSASITAIL